MSKSSNGLLRTISKPPILFHPDFTGVLHSSIFANKLNDYGYISAPLLTKDIVKKELYYKYSLISKTSKKHIFENLLPMANPIILDQVANYNNASANITAGNIDAGNISVNGNPTVTSDIKRQIWVSSSTPTSGEGTVGDIWYQY